MVFLPLSNNMQTMQFEETKLSMTVIDVTFDSFELIDVTRN